MAKIIAEAISNTDATYTAQSYDGIYRIHKYWSKKPHNIIRDFLLCYTKQNDIVVDPFCGSGVTVSEAIFAGRKALGIDINPSAIFITKQQINKVSIALVEEEFKKLKKEVMDEIYSFYIIKRNNKTYTGTHFVWENGELTEVWYKDGRSKVIDQPNDDDLKLASSFLYDDIPYYYPKNNFFHNSRINASRENHVYDLFTPRNLLALSIIFNKIEKMDNPDLRDFFKFCFTASIGQASKMVFVVKRRGKFNKKQKDVDKKEVGSWVIGYWLPKEHFEINAWNCYENRYKRILKAKSELDGKDYCVTECVNFEELKGSCNLSLQMEPAQKALKNIPDNSVDYIITDPPHGNRQPYLELSMLWNSWLRNNVNYEEEIVISESKDRTKNKHDYYKLLNEVLSEIERVLKPNHYFSLMFNSLDDETWVNLIKHTNTLKLDLDKVETMGYSANSVVQDTRDAGLKTDYILTFKKNLGKVPKQIESVSMKNNKNDLIKLIDGYLSESNKSMQTYQILNRLTTELLPQNKIFKLSDILLLLKTEFKKNGSSWSKGGF